MSLFWVFPEPQHRLPIVSLHVLGMGMGTGTTLSILCIALLSFGINVPIPLRNSESESQLNHSIETFLNLHCDSESD